jgi:hypothetical protein
VVVRGGWIASGTLVAAACGRGPFLTYATDDAGDDMAESDSDEPPIDCDLDSHRRDTDGDGIPVWIFDQVGQIIRFDPQTGAATFAAAGPVGWWGAAAHPGE